MELEKLFTVIGVLGFVAAFGIGVMSWAYKGAGSVAILFREVMPIPQNLSASSQQYFQQGIAAYIRGQYRRAAECFTQVSQQQTDCAAAIHNLGLSYANLRQDDRAARKLVKAAEIYLGQADTASADLVKTQLGKLRQRKLEREAQS